MPTYRKRLEAVLRFAPGQWHVTQTDETERPFPNEYQNNKDHGLDVDVVSGEPFFVSFDKLDSETESPSLTEAACAMAAVGGSALFFHRSSRATSRPHLNFPDLAKSSSAHCVLHLLVHSKADCKQQSHDSTL